MKIKKAPRVLHSAALLSPPSGILHQMNWEQEAAINLGIDWQVRMYCPKNSCENANVLVHDTNVDSKKIRSPLSKIVAWFRLRRNYHRWLLQQQNNIDIFLLRYYVHDPYQLTFLHLCKKPVYLVHHTLEVPELSLAGGVSGQVRSKLENLLARFAIPRAEGVIGVTNEIVNYELERSGTKKRKNHVYPNGIAWQDFDIMDNRTITIPELLFVANFAPWHGLDILLEKLRASNEQVILHLVGDVPHELIKLTDDSRIIVHGKLTQEQIKNLSQRCWIGLASFGLFRKKMKEACPLKVRQYWMLGLPVVGDYQEISKEGTFFYKKTNASIEEIVKYAKEMRNYAKSEVSQEMRPCIDKVNLLSKLYSDLQ